MSLFYKDRSASDDGIEEVYINGNMIVGDKLLVNASLIPFGKSCNVLRNVFFSYIISWGMTQAMERTKE